MMNAFSSTATAYDATQWDDSLKKGDVIIVQSERVVGVVDTYPFAVTKQAGELHEVGCYKSAIEGRMLSQKTVDAIKIAKSYDYELADWAVDFIRKRTEIVVELVNANPVKTVFSYNEMDKAVKLVTEYFEAGKIAKLYNSF